MDSGNMGDSHCPKVHNQATRIRILGIFDFHNPETPKLTEVPCLYLSAILILGRNYPENISILDQFPVHGFWKYWRFSLFKGS